MSVERTVGMPVDGGIPTERREDDTTISSRWFAGAYEAGGVIAFSIQRRKNGHVSAYPYMAFREPNEPFITLLQDEYGGAKMHVGNSWEWRLSGYKAAEIVVDMEPYTVSRREMILAMRNWLESDTAERVQIAQEMKGHNRYQDGSVEDYGRLVADPIFVAGVLDNRGTIYPSTDKEYAYPRVEVRSKNRNLLDALKGLYGGLIDTVVETGTVRVVAGRNVETKRDSFAWTTTNIKARELIALISSHLKIMPYKGWDRRLVEERRQERGNQTTQLLSAIQEELGRFSRGEITRLSTAEELAEKFSLTVRTIRRRLSVLPNEVRTQRKAIIKSANTRLLTDQDIDAIVESMKRELFEFQQGQRTTLTYNDGWAQQVEVGAHIIDRNVIPQLPKEIQEQRQHLLYSQATRERNEKYGNPGQKK